MFICKTDKVHLPKYLKMDFILRNFTMRLTLTPWNITPFHSMLDLHKFFRKSPYSVRTQENTDLEKLRIRTLFTQ